MITKMVANLSVTKANGRATGWLSRWLEAPVTVGVSLLCVVVALSPTLTTWLECDWPSVMAGQPWRIVTGHLVHWNIEHLGWDLLVFAVLGTICERKGKLRFVVTLCAATLLIPVATLFLLPQLVSYRGLSGLDTAIFALLAATVIGESWQRREWHLLVLFSGLMAALAAKTGLELLTGATLFVDSTNAGFEPVPQAHIVGGLCGTVCSFQWPEAERSAKDHKAECYCPAEGRVGGGGGGICQDHVDL